MGKVKGYPPTLSYRTEGKVSIPYGKGKVRPIPLAHMKICVSIPYGKGKAIEREFNKTYYREYQFPMGKVKASDFFARLKDDSEYQFPMGKVKRAGNKSRSHGAVVSIPYGKGKVWIIQELLNC